MKIESNKYNDKLHKQELYSKYCKKCKSVNIEPIPYHKFTDKEYPINFRDLVKDIITKEYNRINLEPVNEIVIDNVAWFTWDICDNAEFVYDILKGDIHSLYSHDVVEQFEIGRLCKEISDAVILADYCSV